MAATAAKKATNPTRDEPPADDRATDRGMPERDPNVIYNRAGEPVTLRMRGDEDKFDLERMGIFAPQGWTYEWKTKTIKGWEWVDHQVELSQNGWEPVPASRHDGLCMPRGHNGNIERGGMILMERDERLTAMARQAERRAANEPVKTSRQMAGMMRSNDMTDFDNPEARRVTGVKIERQARIPERNYTYTVDE